MVAWQRQRYARPQSARTPCDAGQIESGMVWPRMSDRPVRPGTMSPVRSRHRSTPPASNTGLAMSPRQEPVRRRTPQSTPTRPTLRYVIATLLVGILVATTLWATRDASAPIPGLGLLDASGRAVPALATDLRVGTPAPGFRLLDTTGRPVALDDFQGQPVVVQFWTSWCLDCVDAIPMFQQLADGHRGAVIVLGVAPGETASRVRGTLDRAGASYRTLLDETSAVAAGYGATSPPLTVVIDASGTIVAIHESRVSTAQIESDLAPLLP